MEVEDETESDTGLHGEHPGTYEDQARSYESYSSGEEATQVCNRNDAYRQTGSDIVFISCLLVTPSSAQRKAS